MKKITIIFLLIIIQNINASNYLIKIEDNAYKKRVLIENIIKYDENGYDQNGYNKEGFNAQRINQITGTIYDEDGFDYLGLGKKILEYSFAKTEVSYCKGCKRVKYTAKYKGATISRSYTFNVIRNGKLLTRGPTMNCNGGQYSTCRLGIYTQLIKPTE